MSKIKIIQNYVGENSYTVYEVTTKKIVSDFSTLKENEYLDYLNNTLMPNAKLIETVGETKGNNRGIDTEIWLITGDDEILKYCYYEECESEHQS